MPNAIKLLQEVEEREEAVKKARRKLDSIKVEEARIAQEIKTEDVQINEPPEFEACVRNGGRVRTKDMGDGKFMRICFDKAGKSHAGEVMTKDEMIQLDIDDEIITDSKQFKPVGENLSLQFQIKEKHIDEKKNTVVAGFLEEDILSANGRFYPASVVREAVLKLPGRVSMIGHETDNVEDVVAKITRANMNGRLAVAEFKFGTDEKSKMIFSKIKEGLVDSTSIRASGKTKRGELNGHEVDVVESLDIFSVDWVTNPGISSAKVLKVFENSPSIKDITTKENTMELAELQKQLDEQKRINTQLAEDKKKADEAKLQAENVANEEKLNAYKEKKLGQVKDDTHKVIVKSSIRHCKTEADIDKEFATIVESLKKAVKVDDKEVVILASDVTKGNEDFKPKTINQLLESDKLKEEEKITVISSLLGKR